MKILIVGAHGKIAQLLSKDLVDAGHTVLGVIRKSEQVAELEQNQVAPVLLDVASASADDLAAHLKGVDATVFAAGAGPNSTAADKVKIDLGGAVLLADAMEQAGVRRTVQISAMGVDRVSENSKPEDMDEVFFKYLLAKGAAETDLTRRDLDSTILRPGHLSDDTATGKVQLADSVETSSVPRADVAAVVAALLQTGAGLGRTLELISGNTEVADAVAAVK